MDPMLLNVLQTQVLDQCNVAMRGLRAMNAGLATKPSVDQDLFWHGCQSFLTGAANVSKLLWGIRGGGRKEAERIEQRRPLRESLGVSDESPLRGVTMRNHFEHIDERIFDWWVDSPRHLIGDQLIGPVGRMFGGAEDRELFRQYDPETRQLVFWGDRYDVGEVAEAIFYLQRRAKDEASKSWP